MCFKVVEFLGLVDEVGSVELLIEFLDDNDWNVWRFVCELFVCLDVVLLFEDFCDIFFFDDCFECWVVRRLLEWIFFESWK